CLREIAERKPEIGGARYLTPGAGVANCEVLPLHTKRWVTPFRITGNDTHAPRLVLLHPLDEIAAVLIQIARHFFCFREQVKKQNEPDGHCDGSHRAILQAKWRPLGLRFYDNPVSR